MVARFLLVLLIALAFVGSAAVVNAVGDAKGTYLASSAGPESLGGR
jgi:hypothetical protein